MYDFVVIIEVTGKSITLVAKNKKEVQFDEKQTFLYGLHVSKFYDNFVLHCRVKNKNIIMCVSM